MNIQTGSRQLLIHGLAMVLAGLVWGFFVPATPYPRLALTAHIEFGLNGLLFIAMAVSLLTLRHKVGIKSIRIMMVAAWLTWALVLSEVASAWWGTNQILPLAAKQAGAAGGEPWQELILKLTHIIGGLGLAIAWALLLAGFLRNKNATKAESETAD